MSSHRTLTGIVYAIDDSRVDLNKQNGWVFNGDFQRLDQGIYSNARDCQVSLVNLTLGHQLLVAGKLAQALSAA